ncbi:hemerythrin HHE cation binding domain-containing protein [Fontibacillus phaseoli]|uniref:Hemerythrin HHE cation binding domain-containing protein n=1 Tax=Fontibacillus phaseoli TaxID=1416533 RepID=A0A369BR36_9BACL|nr:hemerythrin domain-containing protein [Fontibacillus phaseoli]RCX23851.1 hemerythrin HHE cation binding domain-containing protein [Fontibacillus phaseoli]
MAVGPSLRQLHAHKAIHSGGLAGAISKTEEVLELFKGGEFEMANTAADDLLLYWENRIISHADAEEEGFYREIATGKPEMQETITKLTRDHDLLRIIVADIHKLRQSEGLSQEVLRMLHALIVVNEIHSRDEESLLF